ncbi:serine/threonine-protein kinase haspin [Xenentodon cancila]
MAEEAVKDKNCSVWSQKLTLSQLRAEKLRKLQNGNVAEAKTKSTDSEKDAVLALKEKCVTNRAFVQVKRVMPPKMGEIGHLRDDTLKSSTDVSDSSCSEETKTDHLSERDGSETSTTIKAGAQNRSTTCEGKSTSGRAADKNLRKAAPKRKRTSLASKDKKRRSMSADRPGTTRKACVSGMSVSRWKNRDAAGTFGSRAAQTGCTRAADCSISELISTQRKQPKEPLTTTTMNFATPVRASRLNLSSLLADLTPSTHTWSRLKAALSVHRKGMVQLTPRNLNLSATGSPQRMVIADLSQDLFATPLHTPLPRRLQSQLLSQGFQVASEDADLSDAEKVYSECGQQHPLPWDACILPARMKRCVKIGEGTFGEVFSTNNASGDTVALKIIPVEGDEKVNGEDQKTFGEILHEIIISKELSSLKEKQHNQTRGFIGLNNLHCVQGCYPPEFLKAWDAFDKKKGSENDRPDFFEKTQLFLILEFEFGGTDLENSNGTLASLGVAKSILHQVTAALAVAEQELHFEHRDLHWGNVLVKVTRQKMGSFFLNGVAHSVETKGVLVRIIDYSLSRLEIDDLTVSCDISNDKELFMGQGDYQFDVYRLMRQENGNDWSSYHPHTNVLWLHYLCSKLLSMKYRSSTGRGTKDVRGELARFHDNVLQYSSATEALRNCPMFQ